MLGKRKLGDKKKKEKGERGRVYRKFCWEYTFMGKREVEEKGAESKHTKSHPIRHKHVCHLEMAIKLEISFLDLFMT